MVRLIFLTMKICRSSTSYKIFSEYDTSAQFSEVTEKTVSGTTEARLRKYLPLYAKSTSENQKLGFPTVPFFAVKTWILNACSDGC